MISSCLGCPSLYIYLFMSYNFLCAKLNEDIKFVIMHVKPYDIVLSCLSQSISFMVKFYRSKFADSIHMFTKNLIVSLNQKWYYMPGIYCNKYGVVFLNNWLKWDKVILVFNGLAISRGIMSHLWTNEWIWSYIVKWYFYFRLYIFEEPVYFVCI